LRRADRGDADRRDDDPGASPDLLDHAVAVAAEAGAAPHRAALPGAGPPGGGDAAGGIAPPSAAADGARRRHPGALVLPAQGRLRARAGRAARLPQSRPGHRPALAQLTRVRRHATCSQSDHPLNLAPDTGETVWIPRCRETLIWVRCRPG